MWNLDSLPEREFSRIHIVESLQAVHKFDIFAVCESSLNEFILMKICLSRFLVFSTLQRIKSKPLEITISNFQKVFIMIICRHYALMISLFTTGQPQACLGKPKLAQNQVLAIIVPFFNREFVSKRHSVFISMILSLCQNFNDYFSNQCSSNHTSSMLGFQTFFLSIHLKERFPVLF